MTASASTVALARAASAMVATHDVTDVLATLLTDAVTALSANSCGLLLVAEHGRLELLSATSHRAVELELYQVQVSTGPCFDAVHDGEPVFATGPDELVDRWDDVGRAVVAAGFTSVHAFPLRWRAQVLGAMNVFHAEPPTLSSDELALVGHAFADIATLVIVAPEELSTTLLQRRATHALAGRAAVEQAKGVLSFRENIDVEVAYDRLQALARAHGASLTDMARRVLDSAVRGDTDY